MTPEQWEEIGRLWDETEPADEDDEEVEADWLRVFDGRLVARLTPREYRVWSIPTGARQAILDCFLESCNRDGLAKALQMHESLVRFYLMDVESE